jgi:hypothetical protein
MNFQTALKKESWESVYTDTDPNHMFNPFLCTALNIFQASFPVTYKSMKDKNDCIAQEIEISSRHKRSLYAYNVNSNDPKAKSHYIKCCKILRIVFVEAKKQQYSRLVAKYDNTVKTTWKIIKKEKGKVHEVEQVSNLLVNDEKLKDAFINFFITITEESSIQQIEKEDSISILKALFAGNFPSIKIIPFTEAEIKRMKNSLKQKKDQVMITQQVK